MYKKNRVRRMCLWFQKERVIKYFLVKFGFKVKLMVFSGIICEKILELERLTIKILFLGVLIR